MWGYIWNSQIMEEMCVRSESFTVIRAIVFSFPSCIFKENFLHGMTFLNWPKPLIYIRSYRALQRHIHLGHYFNSENRRNLNCCFFLPLCFKQSSEFNRVFLLGKYPPFTRIRGMWCCMKKYLPQPACDISFLQAPALWILWGYAWEVLFLSHMAQSFPAFREAGKAMLMIVISQGAWFQTGILPLQLLLNIKCSSFSLSLFLPIFLHSYLPPSATHPTFFFSPSSSPSFSFALASFSLLSVCTGK